VPSTLICALRTTSARPTRLRWKSRSILTFWEPIGFNAAFQAATVLMRLPAACIAVRYQDTALHGYLFKSAHTGAPKPTRIISGGYDSTAEELYFFSAAAAVARGYTCTVFDGPGQGSAIIEHGVLFRPDWEAVVRPVIDFAISRREVDAWRIALLGISFGGYLAPRAASVDTTCCLHRRSRRVLAT